MRGYIVGLAGSALAVSLVGAPAPANAQGLRYACANERVAIAIPGDKLDDALKALRLATRCPISRTKLAHGKRSRPVVGDLTPRQALQRMLRGTGLSSHPIKGGFQITRSPHR